MPAFKGASRALRRAVQLIVLAVCVIIVWMTRDPLTGFINPRILFELDPLVMFSASLAGRFLGGALLLALLTIIVTLVTARSLCGWLCPLGAVQDVWARVTRRPRRTNETEPRWCRSVKYVLLAIIFAAAGVGIQLAWTMDPLTIFFRSFSYIVHPLVNGAIARGFALLIQVTGYNESIDSFYQSLRESFLAVNHPVFPHSGAVLLLFAGILALVFVRRRFWCRYLCPLGALLAIPALVSPLRRRAAGCADHCSACRTLCRMNAIRPDNSTRDEECILCKDCVAGCVSGQSSFGFQMPSRQQRGSGPLSRGQFLLWAGGALAASSGCGRRIDSAATRPVIRPPGARPESEFLARCIRCGNCLKVCPTNVLQPAVLESGIAGLWSPRFDTRIGYCEYQCTLCTRVCPTGAIQQLTHGEKMRWRMGVAGIDRQVCLPWAEGTPCLVCQEHCPVADKAIKLLPRTVNERTVQVPYIDSDRCVGCALCEFKCPVGPRKAVTVTPL